MIRLKSPFTTKPTMTPTSLSTTPVVSPEETSAICSVLSVVVLAYIHMYLWKCMAWIFWFGGLAFRGMEVFKLANGPILCVFSKVILTMFGNKKRKDHLEGSAVTVQRKNENGLDQWCGIENG